MERGEEEKGGEQTERRAAPGLVSAKGRKKVVVSMPGGDGNVQGKEKRFEAEKWSEFAGKGQGVRERGRVG